MGSEVVETTKSHRDQVRERLLKHLPKNGVGAEIGVWKGYFSEQILDIAQPRILHLIDPWEYQPEFDNTMFGREEHANAMDQYYNEIVERYRDDPRIKIHRMTSDEAFASFEDGELDWVYLDGNHNSPFIEQDLQSALRKVKPNGRIAGDDLHWKSRMDGPKPVYDAVMAVREQLGEQGGFKAIGSQYVFKLNRG